MTLSSYLIFSPSSIDYRKSLLLQASITRSQFSPNKTFLIDHSKSSLTQPTKEKQWAQKPPPPARSASSSSLAYMATGHMIPMHDMAKLFAGRGVASTIITTPSNTALVTSTIRCANSNSISLPPPPPAHKAGSLPDIWDASASIGHLDIQSVRPPRRRPSAPAAPSTIFLPTTSRTASSLTYSSHGPPTSPMSLASHTSSSMAWVSSPSLCYTCTSSTTGLKTTFLAMMNHSSCPIEMTRSQLPAPLKSNTDFNRLLERMHEDEAKSYIWRGSQQLLRKGESKGESFFSRT